MAAQTLPDNGRQWQLRAATPPKRVSAQWAARRPLESDIRRTMTGNTATRGCHSLPCLISEKHRARETHRADVPGRYLAGTMGRCGSRGRNVPAEASTLSAEVRPARGRHDPEAPIGRPIYKQKQKTHPISNLCSTAAVAEPKADRAAVTPRRHQPSLLSGPTIGRQCLLTRSGRPIGVPREGHDDPKLQVNTECDFRRRRRAYTLRTNLPGTSAEAKRIGWKATAATRLLYSQRIAALSRVFSR
jgi:hypothetical protein